MTTDSEARGVKAALGPRQPLRSAIRLFVYHRLRRLERVFARVTRRADYLWFVPSPADDREASDVAARINWYLPAAAREVPIWTARRGPSRIARELVPYMDSSLAVDPSWAASRPSGRPHVVVQRVTRRSLLAYVRNLPHATIVDPAFAYGAEESYYVLHKRYCSTRLPDPGVSVRRLAERAAPGGTAFILGTGPSAKDFDVSSVNADVRITCNSTVRDRQLLETLQPDVIAFSDPVFHLGPSRYAAQFRADLLAALDYTDALLVTTPYFVAPLLASHPEIADRLVVLDYGGFGRQAQWRWPTVEDPTIRLTGNVLTNIMLPVSFALADTILLAGFDGRAPVDNYFWKHNAQTQYSDELMRTVFTAHVSFFRDRDYRGHYDEHREAVESLFSVAEAAGKVIQGVTPSYMEPLTRRGAPSLAEDRE